MITQPQTRVISETPKIDVSGPDAARLRNRFLRLQTFRKQCFAQLQQLGQDIYDTEQCLTSTRQQMKSQSIAAQQDSTQLLLEGSLRLQQLQQLLLQKTSEYKVLQSQIEVAREALLQQHRERKLRMPSVSQSLESKSATEAARVSQLVPAKSRQQLQRRLQQHLENSCSFAENSLSAVRSLCGHSLAAVLARREAIAAEVRQRAESQQPLIKSAVKSLSQLNWRNLEQQRPRSSGIYWLSDGEQSVMNYYDREADQFTAPNYCRFNDSAALQWALTA